MNAVPPQLRGRDNIEEAQVLDPREEDEPADAGRPCQRGRAPSRVHLTNAALDKYGYSEGCVRCRRLLPKQDPRGSRHAEECRLRLENRLRADGDPRVTRADAQLNQRIIDEGGDPSREPAGGEEAARGEGGDEERRFGSPFEDEVYESLRQADDRRWQEQAERVPLGGARQDRRERAARLPQSTSATSSAAAPAAPPPEQAPMGIDEEDEGDDYAGMVDALRRSMPPPLAAELDSIADLLAVHGGQAREVNRAVVELFSPPRVTVEMKRMAMRRRVPSHFVLGRPSTWRWMSSAGPMTP